MTELYLDVKGASIEPRLTDKLTAGMIGVMAHITFDEAWEGLTPKLVCLKGAVGVPMTIGVDGEAEVPSECLIEGTRLVVGLDGWKGTELRIPTILADCGYVWPSVDGLQLVEHKPVTPDIVDQINAAAYGAEQAANRAATEAEQAKRMADSVRDDADAGKFNGPPGEPGKDYVLTEEDRVEIADMARYDDSEIKQAQTELNKDIAQKLTEPDGMAVGKYFRIAAIDENGHAVLEAVNLPVATTSIPGIVQGDTNYGVSVFKGSLISVPANTSIIDGRGGSSGSFYYRPITPYYVDYAVKAAMTDGKGAAWTPEEQAASRERQGIRTMTQESYDLLPLDQRTGIIIITEETT